MLGRTKKSRQLDIFNVPIRKFIDNGHELVLAAQAIKWDQLESRLKPYYSTRGRPSIPPRKLIGLMMLKTRYNLSDEKVLNIWLENPYWQQFCGEVYFQKEKPFSSGEFARFRKRIGEEGDALLSSILAEHFGELEVKTYHTYQDRRKKSFWARLLST